MVRSSRGALAIENGRGLPSLPISITYWPGRNVIFSLGGVRRVSTATRGAGLDRPITLAGILRANTGGFDGSSSISMVASVPTYEMQSRAVLRSTPYRLTTPVGDRSTNSPVITWAVQLPQTPLRQAWGSRGDPARRASRSQKTFHRRE